MPLAGAVYEAELHEYPGRKMAVVHVDSHCSGIMCVCARVSGYRHVLLPDAGFPAKFRKRDTGAVLAHYEGTAEKTVLPGTELPAFDAAVYFKLWHRFPVADTPYADDLYHFLSGSDESQGGVMKQNLPESFSI